ncbi:MAG TPA: hypothetical protein VJR48_13455 [Ktedonobacterales bacterium]|nr:hypothetical protein [Ktedonobacterales bacterium]
MHKPRDEIRGDLLDGRPTLSARADALALKVARLMSDEEARALWERLDSTADHSPAWSQWMNPPYRYLAAFDPELVAGIEMYLDDLYQRAREQARARGWEVEE